MNVREQIEQDLAGLEAGGCKVINIQMNRKHRRALHAEYCPEDLNLPADLYRGIPIIVVEDMGDDDVLYGLDA